MVFFLYCLKGVGIEYIDIVQFEGYLFSDNVDNEHFFRLFIRFHNSFYWDRQLPILNRSFSDGFEIFLSFERNGIVEKNVYLELPKMFLKLFPLIKTW